MGAQISVHDNRQQVADEQAYNRSVAVTPCSTNIAPITIRSPRHAHRNTLAKQLPLWVGLRPRFAVKLVSLSIPGHLRHGGFLIHGCSPRRMTKKHPAIVTKALTHASEAEEKQVGFQF